MRRRCAAAAVEGRAELLLLAVDTDAGTLELAQELALPGLAAPTAAAFAGGGRLWVAGGVAAEGAAAGALTVRVAVRGGDGVRARPGPSGCAAAGAARMSRAAL